MDTAERAIVEHLAKNHLVRTKELTALLLERHFMAIDIKEALIALEKSGRITRIQALGDENLALTKAGLREAANNGFMD